MASKLGPLFSILAKVRNDWTSSLKTSDTQVVVELENKSLVLDVFSEKFRKSLTETPEAKWIFIGQILREDEEVLYAFEDARERTLFEELRSIDGIGPKSAALLVGKLGLHGFRNIIENPKNISTVKVPGLGPKNLEKISLGLKQKKEHFLGIVGNTGETSAGVSSEDRDIEGNRADLERALMQLGLKSFEARGLFAQMCKENSKYEEMPIAQLLQEALRFLGRTRSRNEANV